LSETELQHKPEEKPTDIFYSQLTQGKNRTTKTGKTFGRRTDLQLSMPNEDSIELKEVPEELDNTIGELFAQPGFEQRAVIEDGKSSGGASYERKEDNSLEDSLDNLFKSVRQTNLMTSKFERRAMPLLMQSQMDPPGPRLDKRKQSQTGQRGFDQLSPLNPLVSKNSKTIQTLFGGKIESQSLPMGQDSFTRMSGDLKLRNKNLNMDSIDHGSARGSVVRGNLTDSDYEN